MSTIVISPYNVVNSLQLGGHFWVYMQYVQGLRRLGHEVYWLENFRSAGHQEHDAAVVSEFFKRMAQYGLDGKVILYVNRGHKGSIGASYEYIGATESEAEALFRRADLLLNFHYSIDPGILASFPRTALVDIDPGLLQYWISSGLLLVHPHDRYFTIGETVGTPSAGFPDCGLPWIHIHPPVCLDLWPYSYDPDCEVFSTVSTWWDGQWIMNGEEIVYENNKRVSFLEFADLPRRTDQALELALFLGDGDAEDRQVLDSHGWRVRHALEVARTPEMYRSYIQKSRGEFGCAKPSYVRFQTAWISDRTLCYLASGKPVVVQNTGPSSFLPNGDGVFRFSTIGEAADALATVNASYERQCRTAREIAETYFDARQTVERILSVALR